MIDRLAAIQARRYQLIVRSAELRKDVSRLLKPWRASVSIANRVVSMVRRIKENPLIIPMALILVFSARRSVAGIWIGRLLTLWQVFQSVQSTRRKEAK